MKVKETLKALMHQGKGILAADESTHTIGERFAALGIPSTEDTRRAYREMLVTTPGADKYLSGVILYEETLRQAMADGTPFPEYLTAHNIQVGIKVDLGLTDDPQFPDGQVTKGLDGLRNRLKEYRELGATFTKWRATVKVGTPPGSASVRENASRLAVYAEDALAEGLVPIIEPEVLMDGAHSAVDAEKTLAEALSVVIDALHARDIDLKNVIVKTAMAVPGADSARVGADEVAERTVRALTTALPDELGGVVFLSGGQSPEEATANLNAIARTEPLPWPVTFSFARALQTPAMEAWAGKSDNVADAQAAFLERLTLTVAADAAGYSPTLEESAL